MLQKTKRTQRKVCEMKCSFCGAENVKTDLTNYGGKTVAICVSCRYLDNIKEEEGK